MNPRKIQKEHNKPIIVSLGFSGDVRPAWHSKNFSCRVPLPTIEPRPVKGDIKVFGAAGSQKIPLVSVSGKETQSAYDWTDWKSFMIEEEYAYEKKRPFYSFLPFHYPRVPTRMRIFYSKIMIHLHNLNHSEEDAFPAWPVEQGYEALV